MSEHPAAPRQGVAYPVTLGDSASGGGGGGGSGGGAPYTALKYDWKVRGMDSTKPGVLKRDRDGNKVSVQFQNVVEGERAIRYQVRPFSPSHRPPSLLSPTRQPHTRIYLIRHRHISFWCVVLFSLGLERRIAGHAVSDTPVINTPSHHARPCRLHAPADPPLACSSALPPPSRPG